MLKIQASGNEITKETSFPTESLNQIIFCVVVQLSKLIICHSHELLINLSDSPCIYLFSISTHKLTKKLTKKYYSIGLL